MKLISLNTWGAMQGQIFFDYIKEQGETTDIFCFQEVFSAKEPAPKTMSGERYFLFQELSKLMSEFTGFFAKRSEGYDFAGKVSFPLEHGIAIFVRKSLTIQEHVVISLSSEHNLEDPVEGTTIAQLLRVKVDKDPLTIINYHGPASPGDKLDTPSRLEMSKLLRSLWEKESINNKILCGDFNLMPNTQSVKILETCGKNLIQEFNIQNTRNEISWTKYNNKQYFADYAFVSKSIQVKSFIVPYNLVSDHLPMVVDFDLKIEK